MDPKHTLSLQLAQLQGHTEVTPGFHLFSRDSLIRDQASCDSDDSLTRFDFSAAPFWLMSMGMEPVAIHDEDDLCGIEESGCLMGFVGAGGYPGPVGREGLAGARQGTAVGR